ncbi:hypothetical protein [uncultured Alistipes sp.]|uniref:hypothetical protein n=1 Tax=uncultured Alistipes sp. TaxID=538949 RepID=UPI002593560D|nr:hypothetical protein [uncultured Alistipes sp.]
MKENDMMSYEMYEDFKETIVKTIKTELSTKNSQQGDNDLPQRIEQIVRAEQEQHRAIITQLAGRLESIEQSNIKTQTCIDSLQTSVDAIEIPEELPPRIMQHRISLAIESKGVFWTMMGMMSAIVLLCTMLYWTAKPNYDRIDNDLKYRYLKMKGEATPERIAELEELFELNRDNAKIRQIKRDVEEYERTIQRKVRLEEQARRKVREAERLNGNASRLKNK